MLSEATVKVAVAAVVAAVFLDNAENLDAARSVMRTLGWDKIYRLVKNVETHFGVGSMLENS